jgi:hypothetical protein
LIASAQPALLVHVRSRGRWWVNAALQSSPQLQQAFWALGWLLALALPNRCTLGIRLAPLLLRHLLLRPGQQPPKVRACAGAT